MISSSLQPAASSRASVATTMRSPAAAVDAETGLADAAFLMSTLEVPCLLAASSQDASAAWSVVCELDLLRGAVEAFPGRSVGAVATPDALTVDIEDDLQFVARALLARGSAHAVVLEEGAPAGVISACDIVLALAAPAVPGPLPCGKAAGAQRTKAEAAVTARP